MYHRLLSVLLVLGTCAPQLSAQTTPPANLYVFPLMVDGTSGGFSFRSTLSVASTDGKTSLAPCTFSERNVMASLNGRDGFHYLLEVFDAGFSPLSKIPLNQGLTVLAQNIWHTSAQAPLISGYAELSCPNTVQTQLQFSYFDPSNNKIGEATIPPATKGNSFQFLVDTRDGTRLGFSLANDSAAAGLYEVIARDQFGQVVAFNFNGVIQAFSQVSRFIDEEFTQPTLPPNFVGSIEIVGVPGSQSYAVGLQFTGSVFTTVQPLVRDTPLPF
jgi:hypothetical protein